MKIVSTSKTGTDLENDTKEMVSLLLLKWICGDNKYQQSYRVSESPCPRTGFQSSEYKIKSSLSPKKYYWLHSIRGGWYKNKFIYSSKSTEIKSMLHSSNQSKECSLGEWYI